MNKNILLMSFVFLLCHGSETKPCTASNITCLEPKLDKTGISRWNHSKFCFAFSLQPCTENLYMTLFKEYRETLTPVVLNLIKEIQNQRPENSNDLSVLLQKDAGLFENCFNIFTRFYCPIKLWPKATQSGNTSLQNVKYLQRSE